MCCACILGATPAERQRAYSALAPASPESAGLHLVEVTAIDGRRLGVRHLEAVDGTPIVDVKPVLAEQINRR